MLNLLKSRKVLLIAVDAILLFLSCVVAFFISNSFPFVHVRTLDVLWEILILVTMNILSLYLFKVYQNIWKYARVAEFLECIAAISIGSIAAGIIVELLGIGISNIYMMLAYMCSMLSMIFSRGVYIYIYHLMAKHDIRRKERTLIIGAGDAGREIIQEMFMSDACPYRPVVIVDDDAEKRNMYINSIPIEGDTNDIPMLVEKHNIKNIIFSIPSCDAKNKKRILDICSKTNCSIKTMPYIHEVIEYGNLLLHVKPINIEELLGRDVVVLDDEMMSESISGKVCMVTGGGGSIGSELSRRIAKYNPKQLIIVDIYENNAYEIQQELIRTYGDKLDLQIQIASVRDYDKMEAIFEQYKPHLVYHAAAHKHVPLMETNPEEAVKNNVFGTFNTALLAEKYGVKKFVLVSTDKAVNPTNVMGATKRCCEMIVQYMAQRKSKTEFIAVRFGNVLGSNGSVIPLFEKQIKNNKPITVTHPDIIRYFMTIPEAASLIIQAGAIARGGEIFVLDMGEPVKILTLAENLIRMHGKEPYTDIDIVFTGLRPGEKLYEELLMDEEGLRQTSNDRIFVGQQIHIKPDQFIAQLTELKKYAEENNSEACVMALHHIVPTFKEKKEETQVS